ncbi:11379_t:CDS:2 [Ambispora leptoticha]|uniref:11379_t:CDS:1 n=1 Tax=Ambispora leptoticha TaxID=144679 RepID=A0A9N9DL57_9GLOM|nr:11379_t:CDS:2 [Ambispora leptoticha]
MGISLVTVSFVFLFSSSTGAPAQTFRKRAPWPQLVARASYRLSDTSLFGEFTFSQLPEQITRLLGQINVGFDSTDATVYKFLITANQDGTNVIRILNPKFTVNAPPGGSSAIQLDIPDIALQPNLTIFNATSVATDVHNQFLSIFNRDTLLGSAQILIVP